MVVRGDGAAELSQRVQGVSLRGEGGAGRCAAIPPGVDPEERGVNMDNRVPAVV